MWMSLVAMPGLEARIASARSSVPCQTQASMNAPRDLLTHSPCQYTSYIVADTPKTSTMTYASAGIDRLC